MLYFTFNRPDKNFVSSIKLFFSGYFKKKWLLDITVQQMIKDIDRTDIVMIRNQPIIMSPVLGNITPDELSGGVKGIILMFMLDNIDFIPYYKTSIFGDNCFPCILKVAEKKDIYMYVNSPFELPENKKYVYENGLLEKYGDYDYKIKNMDDNDRLIEGIDNIYKTIFHGVGGVYRK